MLKKKKRFNVLFFGNRYDKIIEGMKYKRPFKINEYKLMVGKFYKTDVWRKIRYEVLKESNGRCCLCGRSKKDGVVLHVDHIIPLSKDFSKALDKNNLQVLCEDCNLGKSNKDYTDWR